MPESLAKQFSDYPASFQPYAEVTAGLLKKAFPDERVKMIVEPGTALVGNTMSAMASVKSIMVVARISWVSSADTRTSRSRLFRMATGSESLWRTTHRKGEQLFHVPNILDKAPGTLDYACLFRFEK